MASPLILTSRVCSALQERKGKEVGKEWQRGGGEKVGRLSFWCISTEERGEMVNKGHLRQNVIYIWEELWVQK